MNFKSRFKKSIENFSNISIPEYSFHELNGFADFVELVLIFSKDQIIAKGDIQDRFFGTKDYSSSEERDKDEAFINSLFDLLSERSKLFSFDYPFIFDESNNLLKKQTILNLKNKLYIFLLLSSHLNIFRPFQSIITNEFELICKFVLKEYLPVSAVIKDFGSNTIYSGTAKEKIRKLGQDLGLEIDEYELKQINERNVKERGLDIIAWIPFDDNCTNIEIFLCQCACGKEFEMKQHDTRRFKNYIKFYKKNPSHVMFIPYSLINLRERKFYQSDLIEDDFLFFERRRILSLFSFRGFSKFKSYKIVNRVIQFEEPLV